MVLEIIWIDKKIIAIARTRKIKIARLILSSTLSIYFPLYSISSTKSIFSIKLINKSTFSNSKSFSLKNTFIEIGSGLYPSISMIFSPNCSLKILADSFLSISLTLEIISSVLNC